MYELGERTPQLPVLMQRISESTPTRSGTEAGEFEDSLAAQATRAAERLIDESPFDSDADFISLNLASRPGQNPYVLGGLNDGFSALCYANRNPHGIHDRYSLIRYKDNAGRYSYAFGEADALSFNGICWTSDSGQIEHVVHLNDGSEGGTRITQPKFKDGRLCDDTLYHVDLLERAFNYDRDTHVIIVMPSNKARVMKKGPWASLVDAAGRFINGY
jgi:hypothetical protein